MLEYQNLNQGSQTNSRLASRHLIWGLILIYFSVLKDAGCQARTVEKQHCPYGKIRGENDIVCHSCPLGKIPNPAKNGCLTCPNGMVSDGFNCSPCLIDNKPNIDYFLQPNFDFLTLKNLVLKITGTQGVSPSQKVASKELLRVADDQNPFGPDDIDVQIKTLLLATGVQPDCTVFIKCPVGTKIKDLTCQPCHDDWRNDPLEESKCSTNFIKPYTGHGDLFVKLSGDALKAHSSLGGYYYIIGGQPWLRTDYERLDHSNAIWNDEENGGWNIGFQVNSTVIMHSPDKVANPIQATSWKYASNGEWIEPIDILVGPGDNLMGPHASLDCSASGFPKETKNSCLFCPFDWVLKGLACHPPSEWWN